MLKIFFRHPIFYKFTNQHTFNFLPTFTAPHPSLFFFPPFPPPQLHLTPHASIFLFPKATSPYFSPSAFPHPSKDSPPVHHVPFHLLSVFHAVRLSVFLFFSFLFFSFLFDSFFFFFSFLFFSFLFFLSRGRREPKSEWFTCLTFVIRLLGALWSRIEKKHGKK